MLPNILIGHFAGGGIPNVLDATLPSANTPGNMPQIPQVCLLYCVRVVTVMIILTFMIMSSFACNRKPAFPTKIRNRWAHLA